MVLRQTCVGGTECSLRLGTFYTIVTIIVMPLSHCLAARYCPGAKAHLITILGGWQRLTGIAEVLAWCQEEFKLLPDLSHDANIVGYHYLGRCIENYIV